MCPSTSEWEWLGTHETARFGGCASRRTDIYSSPGWQGEQSKTSVYSAHQYDRSGDQSLVWCPQKREWLNDVLVSS